MCSLTPTLVPLPMPEEELKELVTKGKDWAIMHGVSMRPKTNFSEDSISFAPFVLFPSVILKSDFQQVVNLQVVFQELLHKVANDRVFLTTCLKNTVQVDSFTAKLFEIYETVQEEGETQVIKTNPLESDQDLIVIRSLIMEDSKDNILELLQVVLVSSANKESFPLCSKFVVSLTNNTKPISLGLLRCDYMLKNADESEKDYKEMFYPSCNWKLIEANTISAGFGWLGPASRLIHRYILQEINLHEKLANLPENNALSGLCEGILEAWKIYANAEAVILVVIENVTYNICDQKFHEYKIKEINPNIKIIRRNLTEIYNNGKLSSKKELIIDQDVVSVVYFRCGYEPCQYPTEDEWSARLLLERSKAIKCPNIQYHLAGTKKVQQELSKRGAIERFIDDVTNVQAIRDVFVEIYGLDFDENGEDTVKLALENSERYVLKPQREGGGNNLYGTEIRDFVEKIKNSRERTAWILMERIFPPITRGYMIRPGGTNPPPISDMVSELGIFGVIIGDSKQIISNRQVGHMLRTKISTANEGGVAAGLGALDSPYLLD